MKVEPAPVAAPAAGKVEGKEAPAAVAKAAEAPPAAEDFTSKLLAAARDEAPPAEPGDIELKAPEGAPEHVVGLVRDVAKLTGLSKDKAQAALEHVHQSLQKQQAEFEKAQVETNAKELWNHPELGGTKLRETLKASRDFIARFVPAEHAARLTEKHTELPAWIHVAFATAQKRISPDTFVPGTPGPAKAGSDSDAKAAFPRSLKQGAD